MSQVNYAKQKQGTTMSTTSTTKATVVTRPTSTIPKPTSASPTPSLTQTTNPIYPQNQLYPSLLLSPGQLAELNKTKYYLLHEYQSFISYLSYLKQALQTQYLTSYSLVNGPASDKIDEFYHKHVNGLEKYVEYQEKIIEALDKQNCSKSQKVAASLSSLEYELNQLFVKERLLGHLVFTENCFEKIEYQVYRIEKKLEKIEKDNIRKDRINK